MYQERVITEKTEINIDEAKSLIKLLGVICGVSFGLLLLLGGIVLSIIAFFNKVNFHGVEVLMIIVSGILWSLAAYCMDLLDEEKKRKKQQAQSSE